MTTPRERELTPGRTGNRLLDRLPAEEFAPLASALVAESLELKQLLIQPDEPVRDVFFPTTALVSTLVIMLDGSEVETLITGAEGVVGLSVALGIDIGLHRAICQVPGEGWRMSAGAFREALARSRPLDALVRRYAAIVLRQTEQVVACNALHP